jgi:tRNA(Ile2)-agmatinylcytidine synthase
MQEKTFPHTFSSYDNTTNKILLSPHGPDPVFYGIRGENPQSLLSAYKLIKTDESLDGYMLFKSNQGTGDHLKNTLDIHDLKPYDSGIISGTIHSTPVTEIGGDVFFTIHVGNSQYVKCAVYKETGITNIASKLIPDDHIKVGGGMRKSSKRHPRVLNIEFIHIRNLAQHITKVNPTCHTCNKKMKSKGYNQGYQCNTCGRKSKNKESCTIPRQIQCKLYLPVLTAHRHLTRPQQRIGKTNASSPKTKFNHSLEWFKVLK